jgi:hypothetical protein
MIGIITMHAADGTYNESHEKVSEGLKSDLREKDPSGIPDMNLDTRLRHF